MDRLVFTAHMAQIEQRLQRQTITNELANVSTNGFKKSMDFATRSVRVEGDGFDSRFLPRAFTQNLIDLTAGSRMATGRPLDIAMNDQTVLGVEAENGDIGFTRRGNLQVNSSGFLTLDSGARILNDSGAPITVPVGVDLQIADDGRILARDPENPAEGEVLVDQLMLRDATGVPLSRRTDGFFTPVTPIGPDSNDFEPGTGVASLTSGVLEGSNVSVVESMVSMIDFSRSFEMQTKVISDMKENDQSSASLMRLS